MATAAAVVVVSIYELLLLLFNEKWCRNKQQYKYSDLDRMGH